MCVIKEERGRKKQNKQINKQTNKRGEYNFPAVLCLRSQLSHNEALYVCAAKNSRTALVRTNLDNETFGFAKKSG
jgi:hypothetical protein